MGREYHGWKVESRLPNQRLIWERCRGILAAMSVFKALLWVAREYALFWAVDLPKAILSLIRDDRLACERDIHQMTKISGCPEKTKPQIRV